MVMEVLFTVVKLILALLRALCLLIVEPIVSLATPRSFLRHDIKGKIVLITGGGSGLGRRVSIRLARKGAIIVSWDINAAGNEETAKMIRAEGGLCYVYTLDLCQRDLIYQAASKVKADIGKVDILVNNAGVVSGRKFIEAEDDQIMKTFDVNLFSSLWTTKAFLPDMMSGNDGQLVTIASIAGYFGAPKMTEYCSSKFAAVGFDDALSQELMYDGYDGISLTLVCPYYINTGMFEGCSNGIIPVLDQDYASDEITDAILMKTRHLILPGLLKGSIAMKGILTTRGQLLVANALGAWGFMDGFTGRKKIN